MAYILNIETATTNCSVSLSKDGKIVGLKEDYNSKYAHAESLHVFINAVLSEAKITPEDVDAIAVSKGPGSYTGLRIGVSAAKGLCFALDKPLISVDTLEALSHQVSIASGCIVTMLDARRLEVYAAVYNSEYQEIRPIQAQVLESDSFDELLTKDKVYFVGSGVDKTKTLITHPNAIFIEGKLPSASEMGILAYDKYNAGNFEDVAYFEPFYLKDFIGNTA